MRTPQSAQNHGRAGWVPQPTELKPRGSIGVSDRSSNEIVFRSVSKDFRVKAELEPTASKTELIFHFCNIMHAYEQGNFDLFLCILLLLLSSSSPPSPCRSFLLACSCFLQAFVHRKRWKRYECHVPRPIIMKEDRGIHSFFRGFYNNGHSGSRFYAKR